MKRGKINRYRGASRNEALVQRVGLKNYSELINYLKERLQPLYDKQSVSLDAGCGCGNSLLSSEMVQQLVGVDVDVSAIRANNDISDGTVGNLETLHLKGDLFDLVISIDVVEHLMHPEKFIEDVARVLKKGGYVFLTTPNKVSIFCTVTRILPIQIIKLMTRLLRGKATGNKVHYYRMNTVRSLTRCLRENGFDDIVIVLLDKMPSSPSMKLVLLPDYLLGRSNIFLHYSLGLLCFARKVLK